MAKEKVEKEYIESPADERIASELKKFYSYNLGGINTDRIKFLREINTSPKGKLATTKKIDALNKLLNDNYDYFIVVYQKNIENFTPAQTNILIFHELMHCDEFGEKIIKHTVEEFYEIVSGFGVDWDANPSVKDPLTERVELKHPPEESE